MTVSSTSPLRLDSSQVAIVKRGRRHSTSAPLPSWAEEILRGIP